MSDFNAAAVWDAAAPRLFPGQEIKWSGAPGHQSATMRCILGCPHKSGDVHRPSLVIHRNGGFACKAFGATGSLKDLVTQVLGEASWVELGRIGSGPGGGPRAPESLEDTWEKMRREDAWRERFVLDPDLASRYLRSGPRYRGDLHLDTAIAIRDARGAIVGIKARLPAGRSWPNGDDRQGKYRLTKGSHVRDELFLSELVAQRPQATVVVCAGEKDALVAASHLPRDRWAPVSGCGGEGTVPGCLAQLVTGRKVVVAYDPDPAGRAGAAKVWRILRGKAAEVRVAVFPDDDATAPKGEGKWDVAAVVLDAGATTERGGRALEAILESALPEPPAGWALPDRNGSAPPAGDGLVRDTGAGAPILRVRDPLAAWIVVNGQLAEVQGEGKHAETVLRFRGVPTLERAETRWIEDPDATGGWAQEQRHTYVVQLPSGPRRTYSIESGKEAFGKMLEDHFQAENGCHLYTERAHMWQWAHANSPAATRVTVRRAIGPTGALGWLCPPSWCVRDGSVAQAADYVVEPPSHANELRRYALADLPIERLREVARWVLDTLLATDHHERALTIPILGAVLVAPIWHYVPAFSTWQRYAFFLQSASGAGKTQLMRYFMSFWGAFVDPEGMSTWRDTVTTIEDLLHRCVGVPAFVPDWKKANFSREKEKEARALLQAYGDRSARGRSNANATTQRRKHPRCQLLIDGEDLPEGQESTLGRMVIVKAQVGHHTGRVATANDVTLSADMVHDLPGLTARWIAWVQRHVPQLSRDLEVALAEVDDLLPHGSTNRSRVVRNYAAQVLTVRSFGVFLEQGLGLSGVVDPLHRRSIEVHVAHATRQLEDVRSESAGVAFLRGLTAVLQAGSASLRGKAGEAMALNPFPGGGGPSRCIGTYSVIEWTASVWPDAAIPMVQSFVSQGGGERIEFSRDAILQQLRQAGIVREVERGSFRDEGGKTVKPRLWVMSLGALGVERADGGPGEGAEE